MELTGLKICRNNPTNSGEFSRFDWLIKDLRGFNFLTQFRNVRKGGNMNRGKEQ